MTVQKRGCLKVDSNSGINQCKPVGTENERKFVGAVLSVLAETTRNVKVDGKMCLCGTDLCDANCKGVALGPVWYVLQYDVLTGCSFKVKITLTVMVTLGEAAEERKCIK